MSAATLKAPFRKLPYGMYFRFGKGEEFAINQRLAGKQARYVTCETGVIHECSPETEVVPAQGWVVEA